jgi:hypothetical protein
MTAANFSENDASRQMPLNRRTPRIARAQPERRMSTSETNAMVIATRTVETAMMETAFRTWPLAMTGPVEGMVKAGGAGTGGRGTGGGVTVVDGVDAGDGEDVDCPCGRGETALTRAGCCRDVGAGVGAGALVGAGVGAGVAVGLDDGSQQPSWSRRTSDSR